MYGFRTFDVVICDLNETFTFLMYNEISSIVLISYTATQNVLISIALVFRDISARFRFDQNAIIPTKYGQIMDK